MHPSPNVRRRSMVLGFGTVAVFAGFKGCGGSGSPDGGGGSSGGGASSGLTGSFWYRSGDNIVKVSGGGTSAPQVMVPALLGAPGARPQISRKGPRYLQALYSGDDTLLQVYDHGNNQPYCYITVPGYVGGALVSPSGNFIAMQRSPDIVNAALDGAAQGIENIIGLNVADVSDPNSPRLIRSEYSRGPSCVINFAWLDNDQFLYMALDGGMFTGSATAGAQGDKKIGQLNDQGLKKGGFDVHPDGTTMAVCLISVTDESVFDNHLYKVNGELVARLTATGQGSTPNWSPDGKYFSFTHGYTGNCEAEPGCIAACESFFVSSGARNVTRADAQPFDRSLVPCVGGRAWSAVV